MDHDKYAEMSGEGTYRTPRSLELNEILINGDGGVERQADGTFKEKGGYLRKRIKIGAKKDTKPEEINLGKSVQVVFLKIRRRLIERGEKGTIICSTGEHNSPDSLTQLYVSLSKERYTGVASELRSRFPGVRTIQVVYALLLGVNEPELVRVIVRGAALGSEAKAEGVQTFYQYISSFPKGEHMYEYVTVLSPIAEKGQQDYFTIKFDRGERLDDVTQKFAYAKLEEVFENCKAQDQALAEKVAALPQATVKSETTVASSGPGIDYPKDEINPDDIPF